MPKLRSTVKRNLNRQVGLLFADVFTQQLNSSVHPYWYDHGVVHLLLGGESQQCVETLLAENYIWKRLSEAPKTKGYDIQKDYRIANAFCKAPSLQSWFEFLKESTSLLSRDNQFWARADIWHQLCDEVSVQNPFFEYRPDTSKWSAGQRILRRSQSPNEQWRIAVQGMAELLPDGIRGGSVHGDLIVVWGYQGAALVHASLEQEPLVLEAKHAMTRGATMWKGSILTWGEDGIIRQWDTNGGLIAEQDLEIPLQSFHWVDDTSVLVYPCSPWYDPDEDPEDGTIIHWDLEKGESIRVFEAHEGDSVQGLLLEGEHVLSWDRNGFIIQWSLLSGEVVNTIEAHSGSVVGLSRIDADRLISTGSEGKHRVWTSGKKKGKKLSGLSCYAGHIHVGEHIAAWDDEGGLSFHHIEQKKPIAVQHVHTSWIDGAMHWKDNIILTWTTNLTAIVQEPPDPAIRVWDIETGTLLGELHGHQEGIQQVCITDDGLVSSSTSSEIIYWGDPVQPSPKVWNGHSAPATMLLPLQKSLLLSADTGGVFFQTSLNDYVDLESIPRSLRRISTFLCGEHIISVSFEGQVDIFDRDGVWKHAFDIFEEHDEQGIPIPWYKRPFGKSAQVGIAHSDSSFWISQGDGGLKLWNLQGECLCTYEGHTKCISDMGVLDDGSLISLSWDNSAILWNADGSIRHHWTKFSSWTSAYFQVDHRIYIGDMDGTIRVFDVHTGKPIARLKGLKTWVLGFVALQDGRILAHGYDAKGIPIWMPDAQKKTKAQQIYKGHGVTTVSGVIQLRNGDCASYDHEGHIHVWDPNTCTTRWQYCVAKEVSESEAFALRQGILGVFELEDTLVVWTSGLRWFQLREGVVLVELSEEEVAWMYPQWLLLRQKNGNLRTNTGLNIAWPDGEGRRKKGQEERYARHVVYHSAGNKLQWHHHDTLKLECYDDEGMWISNTRGELIHIQQQST